MDDKCTNCGMIVEAGWNPRRAISGRPYCPLCFADIMNEERRSSWGILAHLGPAPSGEDIAAMRREAWASWDGDSGSEGYAKV